MAGGKGDGGRFVLGGCGFCISANFRVGYGPGQIRAPLIGCSVHLASTTGIATGAVSPSYSQIENLNQRRFGLVSVMAFSLPRRLGSYEASL